MLLASLTLAVCGDGHAALHPEGADWYVEVPQFPAAIEAYRDAPLVRLVNDPEVRAAFASITAGFEEEIAEGLAEMGGELGMTPEELRAVPAAALEWARALESASFSFTGWTRGVEAFGERAADWRAAHAGLVRLAEAVDAHAATNGGPPADLAALPGLDPAWTIDPWGRAYAYAMGGVGGYTLTCLGADGRPGGDGVDADLEARIPLATVLDPLREAIPLGFQGLLVLRFREDGVARASADRLVGLLESTGADVEDSMIRLDGAEGRVRTFVFDVPEFGPEPPSVWVADGPRTLVLGAGAGDAAALEARAAGQSRSLAHDPLFGRVSARVAAAPGGTLLVRGFERLTFWEALWLAAEIQDDETARGIARLFADRTPGAWTTHLSDGGFETRSFATNENVTTLERLLGHEPVHLEVVDDVPDDAILVAATTVDWAGLFRVATDVARAEGGEDVAAAVDGALGQWRTQFGLDVPEMLGSLGPGAVAYMQPIAIGVPNAGVILEVRDVAAFERGLMGVSGLVAGLSGGGFSFESRAYKKIPVWTLRRTNEELPWGGAAAIVDQAFGGMMAPSPSVAVIGDRAVVGLTAVQVKRMIKRKADEDREIHPFRSMAAADATGAFYMDWAGIWLGLYRMGRSFLTMSQGFAGDEGLPFDPADLPDPETLAAHFEPTVGWTRPVDGGVAEFVRSSFGPEIWLGGVVPLGAGLVSARRVTAEVGAARAAQTRVHGQAVVDAARRYAILNDGRLPAALDELTAADEGGQAFLADPDVALDGWDRPFRYEVLGGGGFRLWSAGPDGVDQDGDGDDVVVQ